jgi:hypothetical protein
MRDDPLAPEKRLGVEAGSLCVRLAKLSMRWRRTPRERQTRNYFAFVPDVSAPHRGSIDGSTSWNDMPRAGGLRVEDVKPIVRALPASATS